MNNCHFIGKLIEDPILVKHDNVDLVYFKLAIEEFIKSKNGKKIRRVDVLTFEAWHTGAVTIAQNSRIGDILAVNAVARNYGEEAGEEELINFRVVNFKIFGKDKWQENNE